MNISLCNVNPYGPSLVITIKNQSYVLCFCHHLPERSIKFIGIEKYLCARCFGIFVGGFVSILFVLNQIFIPSILIIPLLLPLIIDGFLQCLTNYYSNNTKRFVSGFLFGLASVFLGLYLRVLFDHFI